MTKDDFDVFLEEVFSEIRETRDAGQKEYSHRIENVFANFERVAGRLHISREKVLMVYVEKHIDGIHAHINGHVSQREPVTGRIKDVIVYMMLLWGMMKEDEKAARERSQQEFVRIAAANA